MVLLLNIHLSAEMLKNMLKKALIALKKHTRNIKII